MTDSLHKHNHTSKKNILSVKKLVISYGKEKIIDNIDFEIKENTFISLLGINGSGKTTILKSILNLIDYKGDILLYGKSVKKHSAKELAKKIAYVPQIMNIANQEISIYDYISFGRFPYSGSFSLTKEDKLIIKKVINQLDLENTQHKPLSKVSGGQRQKVALATALVQDTEIIILDEPTTYLDLKNQYEILEILHMLHLEGKTIIVVLHDLNQAIKYCDQVALIHQNKLFKISDPHSALTKENIKDIYGIEVLLQKINNKNHIIDINTKPILEKYIK